MSEYDKKAEKESAIFNAVLESLSLERLKELVAKRGYELRRKGRKVEKRVEKDADGNPIKNCYLPHFKVTASGLARAWKVTEDAQKLFGFAPDENGEVWEHKLLLALEHIIRWRKHEIKEPEMLRCIDRLCKPLAKSEYLNRRKGSK